MPTITTNKSLKKPTYQEYNADATGWTDPINGNWQTIDNAFGGTYSPPALTSSSSDITLTAEQCENVRIKLTGTTATPKTINLFFPATLSGVFVIDNATSGPFTINVKNAGAGVEFIVAVQDANTLVWVDQSTFGVYLADNSPVTAGSGISVSGSTISLTAPVTVANGGTGATAYTAGQLLIGNASGGLTPATLTQGANVTITNGNGAITIAATGGTSGGVTTFQTSLSGLTPTAGSAGAVTLAGTLGVASGGTGATTATAARTALGLGTIATQAASSVAITGGSALGMGAVRVGTSSALSGAEGLSVFVASSTDGVVSKVSTNTNANFIGQNSSGTETFVVDGTGSMYAGTAASFTGAQAKFVNSSDWALEAYSNTSSSTANGAVAIRVNNTANSLVAFFANSTSIIGTITTTGSATAYNTSSDYRLKENVADLSNGVSAIKALRPVSYTWKANPSLGTVSGFIAHEAQAIVPQAVNGVKDAVNPDGSIRAQGIDHSMLVPILTAAVKELIARIEVLEAKTA